MEFPWNKKKKVESQKSTPLEDQVQGVKLPKGRTTVPDIESAFSELSESLAFVTPDFNYEYIPVIRKLAKTNSSVFRSATILAELINPGFTLTFDGSVTAETKVEINDHLKLAYKRWGLGTAGIHGIVNKLIYQIYIGGALSGEWVLRKDLKGVDYIALVDPENIRPAFNHKTSRYDFWQVPKNWTSLIGKKKTDYKGIKLNPATYVYYGLFTDQEKPIGTPPFLSALDDINSQLKMLRNIGFITDQLGLMGFLEVLLNKPVSLEGEKSGAYKSRLGLLLKDAKTAIKDGLKDGVISGYKDEHEFKFHPSTKDMQGVPDIFGINQRMLSNGLLLPSQFLGGDVSGAETQVLVAFTLMLSQLYNIQQYLASFLEHGIWLELTLANFKFKTVEVKFNKSTVTDQYKDAQTEEIRIRNSDALYASATIGQQDRATRHGIAKPDQEEPRVDVDSAKINGAAQKAKDQDVDNTSDKKTRDAKKTQPNPEEKRGKSKK